MTQLTIRQATPTGKTDPTFGTEYIVNFEGDERDVKLSAKTPPQPGDPKNGQIIDGKYGAYFKKDPYNPSAPTSTATEQKQTPKYVPYAKKDNSDGQRQGMCINNAASYINTGVATGRPMNPDEWASTVHEYATALYQLGDLAPAKDLENVQNVFAGAQ